MFENTTKPSQHNQHNIVVQKNDARISIKCACNSDKRQTNRSKARGNLTPFLNESDEDFGPNMNRTNRIRELKIRPNVNITSRTCGMIFVNSNCDLILTSTSRKDHTSYNLCCKS